MDTITGYRRVSMMVKRLNKDDRKLILLLLPSLLGFLIFYIIPFSLSFLLSVIDNNVGKNFVGLWHYKDVLANGAFRLAIKNTVFFLSLYLPVNLTLPLAMALLIRKTANSGRNFFIFVFMLPLVIPTGSMVFFWKSIFGINGVINGAFFRASPVDWLNTDIAPLIIILILTWKNAGYNMVLYLSGLSFIPKEYYEFASIEGAKGFQHFIYITLPGILPTCFLVLIMSIINSFNSFKEIYLLSGSYPHQSIYLLQHYMNNQFAALNYQKLAAASYLLSLLFILMSFIMFRYQNRRLR